MNSIFNNYQNSNGNPGMLGAFTQFKQMLEGKNPEEVLNNMLKSGKFSQSQVNQAMEKAKMFANILK